ERERVTALAQPGRYLGEDPVALRMPEAVVDPLEVVDVDETEGERPAAAEGVFELARQAFVKVSVIAETRQRISEREAHRSQRAKQRALVQLDREQRPDERKREQRRPLPEDDERQNRRAHQRERQQR